MKKLLNLLLLTMFSVVFFGCDEDEPDTTPTSLQFTTAQQNNMTVVSGSTEQNFTMKAGTTYMLKGFVYVKEGATLTIEPGTVIKGDKATKGTLIIERGGKIMANGTAANPIVFTSAQPAGQRSAGDWGGIIILGKAPVNAGASAKIEGGVDRNFGGTDVADNSGVLKYVRIEFPGIAFQPDNEINGLTLGGVGAGTTIDYVQVSYSGDDSFEWFGGTVNAKHLIAYKTVDDMFDTDLGYTGKLQYLIGISDPNVADASGSNGFESDNDGDGTTATPITAPTYSNVTLFGPLGASATPNANFKRALHLRRNNRTKLHNSIVMGFPVGLLLDGSATETNATNNDFRIQNTIIAAPSGKALTLASGSTFDINTWYNATAKGNAVLDDASSLNINGAYNATPGFVKASTTVEPSFTGLDSFFDQVDYVGAFGATDWTAGWANFDPKATAY
ncbi:T9SS C-terminal target domain-containing protein [Botryobacter ruber]|uniref:T9SS C-terminal target domain-containing protein n=1 Tax=Botryobacter ruber TaxID=2171629 RepID=UPI000E0BEF46|nr:T9SS C-terminal target domain-containing protein [Botryobacter ruber]